MAAAEDRILAAGERLLEKTPLSTQKKTWLRKTVTRVQHHNADVRRLRRFEAIAGLIEDAVDSLPPVQEPVEEVEEVEEAVIEESAAEEPAEEEVTEEPVEETEDEPVEDAED
jgi:hypothetical protein